MTVDEILLHLKIDGWCVIEGVIPEDDVDAVRNSVSSTTVSMDRNRELTPGGVKSNEGVGGTDGLIVFDQSFAPYLADKRIMGVAETLFGPHVRVSFSESIVNSPGHERGAWHSDWPFNQTRAGHIPAPYPDAVMHLSTVWMLSEFTPESGGTLIVPGSHRANNNPSGDMGIERFAPYPTEMQATGPAGSVLIFDSRLWHAAATNNSDKPRVAMTTRYAPWWLNLDVLMPGSMERTRMVDETGLGENKAEPMPLDVYESLHEEVKPLFRHWVRG